MVNQEKDPFFFCCFVFPPWLLIVLQELDNVFIPQPGLALVTPYLQGSFPASVFDLA